MFNNVANPIVNKTPVKVWDIDEDLFTEAMNSGLLHKSDCMQILEQQTKERRKNAN